MPLERGSSKAVISRNISEMSKTHPHDQAVAAAMRMAKGRATGGSVKELPLPGWLKKTLFTPTTDIPGSYASPPTEKKVAKALGVPATRAAGGKVSMPAMPWFGRSEARGMAPHVGALVSSVPGRTDHLPIKVSSGSYVIPADTISALGQGNTLAGMNILHQSGLLHPGKGPRKKFAAGGDVPIMAAGGEAVIHPETVARIGHGDIKKGHDILDAWVKKVRSKTVKTLKKLPGPAK